MSADALGSPERRTPTTLRAQAVIATLLACSTATDHMIPTGWVCRVGSVADPACEAYQDVGFSGW